jgi:DNA-binding GntR family transcriptional regulator
MPNPNLKPDQGENLVVLADMGLANPRAYVRLAAILRQQIADGTLQPGERTPSLTHLNHEYGHARLTCSKALRTLEGEGLLTRIRGLGYHARVRLTNRPVAELRQFRRCSARKRKEMATDEKP